MITLEQAKNLNPGTILLQFTPHKTYKWKVNGKPKTWKRSPEKVKVPLRYGLYTNTYLCEMSLNVFHPEETPEKIPCTVSTHCKVCGKKHQYFLLFRKASRTTNIARVPYCQYR